MVWSPFTTQLPFSTEGTDSASQGRVSSVSGFFRVRPAVAVWETSGPVRPVRATPSIARPWVRISVLGPVATGAGLMLPCSAGADELGATGAGAQLATTVTRVMKP